MFRNQYDNDVTTWSPQGRIHQIEYAMETVKLGSITVGLKNHKYAVLLALKRSSSGLSSCQKKIIPIDSHVGISISGITADAMILGNHMRTECLNYKYTYDNIYPISRLILNLSSKMHTTTQRYDRRPYGVGLLVAGFDDVGPHIYQVLPTANFFNCKAMSIGSRSQIAQTYLKQNLPNFANCSKDDLICIGIQAIHCAMPSVVSGEEDPFLSNISIGIVGENHEFKILQDIECLKYTKAAVKKMPFDQFKDEPEEEQASSHSLDYAMSSPTNPSGSDDTIADQTDHDLCDH